MTTVRARGLQLLVALTLVGCAGAVASPDPTREISPSPREISPSPQAASQPIPSALPSATGQPPESSRPAAATSLPTDPPTPAAVTFDQPWAVATLTDVSTGEQFRIADLAASGKVVFVEPMAIWCSNCRAQQVAAVAAFEELDPATVEWVGVDVETSETPEALARYRDQNGFPFRYVVADSALSRAFADQFGDVVLSPPSVNVVILGTDGRITHLLGHHDAAELVALAIDHAT